MLEVHWLSLLRLWKLIRWLQILAKIQCHPICRSMGCSISQAVQNLFVVADSLKDSFLCIYIYILYYYLCIYKCSSHVWRRFPFEHGRIICPQAAPLPPPQLGVDIFSLKGWCTPNMVPKALWAPRTVQHLEGTLVWKGANRCHIYTMWGPQTIAKLVQITPINMVYGTYNYSYFKCVCFFIF